MKEEEEMAQIEIKLEKQLLTIQNREVISSGDVNYDSCRFEFDESWEGYIKTAVFYQEKQKVYYAVLDNENKCYIPAPAIVKASPLYIGVFGVKGNKILTSSMDSIPIVEGAVSGAEVDVEPSETVFAAIVANYQAILDTITEQNRSFEEAYRLLTEQNALLEKLNAFEIAPQPLRVGLILLTAVGVHKGQGRLGLPGVELGYGLTVVQLCLDLGGGNKCGVPFHKYLQN